MCSPHTVHTIGTSPGGRKNVITRYPTVRHVRQALESDCQLRLALHAAPWLVGVCCFHEARDAASYEHGMHIRSCLKWKSRNAQLNTCSRTTFCAEVIRGSEFRAGNASTRWISWISSESWNEHLVARTGAQVSLVNSSWEGGVSV